MSRVLKFRAWQDNRMLTQKEIGIYATIKFFNQLYEDALPMQFTGLKDETGAEVYEDDIVEIWYPDGSGNKRNEKVIYRDNSACFDTQFVEDWLRARFKVIGNIYENPNLLTKEAGA